MVDVDDLAAEFLAKPIREDLHEASQHRELNLFLRDDLPDALKACLFVVAVHLDEVEGDACLFGNRLAGVAVADDRGDLNGHFAEFGSPEHLVQAVVGFGHQHRGAHLVRESAEVPGGGQRFSQRVEARDEVVHFDLEVGGVNFHACKKLGVLVVGKLG